MSAEGVYERGVACSKPNDVEEYKQKIIAELVKARNKTGLSQKQLEILSGVAQPCIARTEKGATDPKLTTLLKMLEPLGLTLTITTRQPINE
ncbi:MAG TPA: XRE family transcriptional regulator [Clostridiales bacterium]|nr:XRE family transcriptional regulator [Clostridiales bacterium]